MGLDISPHRGAVSDRNVFVKCWQETLHVTMKMHHRMAAGKVKNLYDHALLPRVVLKFF